MQSIVVVFVLMALVVYWAETITDHEWLAMGLRGAAVVFMLAWVLNVWGCVQLPIRPW